MCTCMGSECIYECIPKRSATDTFQPTVAETCCKTTRGNSNLIYSYKYTYYCWPVECFPHWANIKVDISPVGKTPYWLTTSWAFSSLG